MRGHRGLNADQPLRVAAIGGGTGLAALLRAVKGEAGRSRDPWRLTGVVTVSDNGGSSGRLRAELGGIPPGDLRNCLSALTMEESILSDLLSYRFGGQGALGGHSLGNLILLAMADLSGDWVRAIRQLSTVLVTVGRLYPSTSVPVTLIGEDFAGNRHVGEVEVGTCQPPLARIWLEPLDVEPLPEAVLSLMHADLILIAPGSLYTSTLASLLIPELRSAILRADAPVVYIANLMTEPSESIGLDLEAHMAIIQSFGGFPVSAVLGNNTPLPEQMLHRYQDEGGAPLYADKEFLCGVPVFSRALLDPDSQVARHHPSLLNQALRDVIEAL